ncbi:MAG TPA: HAMP domain-containing sensor histidine kinase [Solirubrobacteraceae bacterium]|nr:HAMP domain-containing sensor histidine kinase [Solirubrobacteraceae bacterium]
MSLRARLLIGLVVLAAIGLGAAALVTYEEQRSFLLTKIDQQVAQARLPVSVRLGLVKPRLPAGTAGAIQRGTAKRSPSTFQASGTYGILLGGDGKVVKVQSFSYDESAAPVPSLPAHFPMTAAGSSNVRIFTVSTAGVRYRAAAFSLTSGRVLVIAVPLNSVDQTLQRLVVVEALVGGGVILTLILLGWLVIRIGLRPLNRIGRVADEIAHGDLSRRVRLTHPRTELGRLGASLNEMLVQIEQAFADRGESEERLRRFVADASHELRTPLASIRGYAELFRLGAASEPAALERTMARIEAEATRMGGMVEDLLTLARLDELPEVQFVPVDLRVLAETAVHDAHAVAPGRPISLIASEPVRVLGDPGQLRQVLSNLTRNALIHTGDGTPIEVMVSRRGPAAEVVVRDHGPGLPAGSHDRLFERFWRDQTGRSRGPGGAGLGLAIVKAVAHAHHAEVRAEDAPDGGAVFRVTIPLAPSAPAVRATADDTGDAHRVAVSS